MPTTCYSSVKGLAMRATRLNADGTVAYGVTASAVSAGFVSLSLADNLSAGEQHKVMSASGDLCIDERERDFLNWIDVQIEFCNVDAELVELLTGMRVLHDQAANSVGFTKANVTPTDFALEVWTKVGGPSGLWIYWLLPRLTNGWFSDITIADAVATFKVKANTARNPLWGVGPYDVVGGLGGASPLTLEPVSATEHLYSRVTEIAPPLASCGYVPLITPALLNLLATGGDDFVVTENGDYILMET